MSEGWLKGRPVPAQDRENPDATGGTETAAGHHVADEVKVGPVKPDSNEDHGMAKTGRQRGNRAQSTEMGAVMAVMWPDGKEDQPVRP